MVSANSRGVYRLAKEDICTILVHIPMLEGKSSMGKKFQIVPMKFRPSTSRLKIPIFALYVKITNCNLTVLAYFEPILQLTREPSTRLS